MKIQIIIFLLCFFSIQLYSQIELPEITILEDTTILSKTQIIDFEKYKVYILPKEYGNNYSFGYPNNKRDCFDIDTILVREIENELLSQYIFAERNFMQIRFQEMIDIEKNNPGTYDKKALKKSIKEHWKNFEKNKELRLKELEKYDRQILGCYSISDEKIILIHLIPQKYKYTQKRMKQGFAPMILGANGTDVLTIHYHINSKKITVNEEF